jgi:hypothetical protein
MLNRQEFSSLRQGLVGAWCQSLGASGYTLIDRSGLGQHGTLTNMDGQTTVVGSGSGLATQFDGVNDYVSIPMRSRSLSSMTITGWAYYITSPAAFRALVFTRSTLTAGVFSSGATGNPLTSMWTGTAGEYGAATGLNIPTRTWFFFAMVLDGQALTTWLNAQSFTVSITQTTYNIGQTWTIGTDIYIISQRSSNALIDDVRIYSRAITLSEIRLLASRRGIGLSPLPDRAAGLPRKLSVNVGGSWRAADAYVRTATDWRLSQASVNVGGVWK